MTNRVEFELEITGFKLKVKGSKESAAQITSQVSNTLRGLITPPSLDEKDSFKRNETEDTDVTVLSSGNGSSKKRARRKKQLNSNLQVVSAAIEFKHEPEKYGIPTTKWSTATKSLWLLYVVKQITKIDAMTTNQIIETFNKHFKQAKTISNVARDLGNLKMDSNLWIGEDTTKSPHEWYITESGEKHVQKLIAEQKTQSNGVN
ncbi:MAG: hypothetical protein WKF85_07385 [Chitinophagaceae bacterium]